MAQYDINKIQLPNGDICNIIAALDRFYPVGSIYISINSTNPGTIFGGTWTSFGAGRVLVGVDPEDEDFNTAGNTGGEKEHTLTQGELPKTTGSMTMRQWTKTVGGSATFSHSGIISKSYVSVSNVPLGADSGTQKQADLLTISFGNDEAHNNLQPYITCYMWLRTAQFKLMRNKP